MLSPREERRLRVIELCVAIDDARFAAGLRDGRPREPREYRRRRYRRVAWALPVLVACPFTGDDRVLLVGLLAVAALVGVIGWSLPR